MDFSSQGSINDEVTCRICLQLLTEPLNLDCGHSFCHTCITANNESVSHLGGQHCCPVCKSTYEPWNLLRNQQLGNIVKKVGEINMWPHQQHRRDLCEHHGENRHLFCKEDGKAICSLCVQEHQGHQISLVEEVVKECQEKLEAALDRLTQEQLEVEELEAVINEERATWKNHTQAETERIRKGFDEMRNILDREEQRELQKLREDEVHVMGNLAVVSQQKQFTRELISDLQHHMCELPIDTLQDVKGTMKRSKTFTLKKPKALSTKQRTVFQAPDLRGMVQVFNEPTDARNYWVDVTLNTPMKKSIVISADRRQVRPSLILGILQRNNEDFGVLGSPSITSGKHYWEVDVSQKRNWILGVYGGKYPDSNMTDFIRQVKNSQPACSKFQPKYGYWVIGLQNHSEYKAFVDSDSSDPTTLTLFLSVPLRRVGVFLDYDVGTVSFFNITNHEFPIYKLSSCSFSQKMFPYFNPMICTTPMTLCSPGS